MIEEILETMFLVITLGQCFSIFCAKAGNMSSTDGEDYVILSMAANQSKYHCIMYYAVQR